MTKTSTVEPADPLAALLDQEAKLPGEIEDAAARGDMTALIGLRAQADALPHLIH